MASSDALLWMKYEGLPTISEVNEKGTFFAFKCKKYAYWSQVHTHKDSKESLLQISTLLSNGHVIDVDQYECLLLIWERVQRWKKDKENLSLEPTKSKEFARLESLCKNGSEEYLLVASKLQGDGFTPEELDPIEIWQVFKAVICRDFLISTRNSPENLKNRFEKLPDFSSDHTETINSVSEAICDLYDYHEYEIEKKSLAVDTLLVDFDLPAEKSWKSSQKVSSVSLAQPKVLVSSEEAEASVFVTLRQVRGDIVITINPLHPFFKLTNFHVSKDFKRFINCFGLAALDDLGNLEHIEEFLSSLGSRLRSGYRK